MSEVIRQAATLILLRDAAQGPEVFMLRRAQAASFLGGAYVFPGGALEASDFAPATHERMHGLDDPAASTRLGIRSGGLAYWAAAMRECFEEAGILVASSEDGSPLPAQRLAWLLETRDAVSRGDTSLVAVLREAHARMDAAELVYCDHWVTPPLRPRRFDTRFFIARAPVSQQGSHDNTETVHSFWVTPHDALVRNDHQEIELAFATRVILGGLACHRSVDAALAAARARTNIEVNRPTIAQGREGPKVFRLGDAPYHEIHWSDPTETTTTTYDLLPGVPKQLDALVTRIIAPNAGMMTGPGTNTYLVGTDEMVVIDPGPLVDSHISAIVEHAAGRLRWILCTHTHHDHSPAANALRARTGALIIGQRAPDGANQDRDFKPDRTPLHNELLELGAFTLRALHTPGHASNHVCYLAENTRMLFTGDHVMQGSTVIINPPDGDMTAYLASLEMLRSLDVAIIAPGHGYLIGSPQREIARLIKHRLWRERRLIVALRTRGPATAESLVPFVYDDVPATRHAAAARSLLAHLDKLEREHRLVRVGGLYRLHEAEPGSAA
ncbi:MAG: MBL fold metallo-hydrolase [Pseudomonadota bacterium]|nr:MBL fold metallo-hydrolase [Pseudomonadota bacterium]